MSSNTPSDIRETISALVDGEASEWELRKILQSSDSQQGIKEDWADYQKISSVLKKEPLQGVDISSSIMAALDDEKAHSKLSYFRKTLGQTAIAASVAVVALVGIQQYQVAQNNAPNSSNIAETEIEIDSAPLIQAPAGFEYQPLTRAVSASNTPAQNQNTQVQIPVDREQIESHFNELVQEHSDNSVNSVQSAIPMVRAPSSNESE